MTRDDLAPLGTEDEGFPCPECLGSGFVCRIFVSTQAKVTERCRSCNGSGYGPPPPEVDRLMQHCLNRLRRWAERHPLEEEV